MAKNQRKQSNRVLFGNSIREARTAANLTLEEAAKSVEATANFLSDLECGDKEASLGTIYKLAETYKVDVSNFFRWSEPQTAEEWRAMINAWLERCSTGQLRKIHRIAVEILVSDIEALGRSGVDGQKHGG